MSEQLENTIRLVLVTGMSGAGNSTALKALEDQNYEAVDNLPLSLLHDLIPASREKDQPQGQTARNIAVGIDSRTRGFHHENFVETLTHLRSYPGLNISVIFMDCDDEVLERRFTETRRRHPMAIDRPVSDGIRYERDMTADLRGYADLVIDSTKMSANDLRMFIARNFAASETPQMHLVITSFAYRHGLPRNADLVFDVRFLDNPHYVEPLRHCTGLDGPVQDHVRSDPAFEPFVDKLLDLLRLLLPHYTKEGKSYLTLAFGCTGGQHRSVFTAEHIAALLKEDSYRINLVHRDIPAESVAQTAIK